MKSLTLALLAFAALLCAFGALAQNETPTEPRSAAEVSVALTVLRNSIPSVPDSAFTETAKWAADVQRLNSDTLFERFHYTYGLAFDYLGELDSAIVHYEKAKQAALRSGDLKKAEGHEVNKGIACYYAGLNERAIEHYHAALDMTRQRGDVEVESKILNNLAILHRSRNDFKKAIETYQRSINIKKELGDSAGMATSYFNKAKAHYQLDDYNGSEAAFDSALMYGPNDALFTAQIQALRALNALETGNAQKADSLLALCYPRLQDRRGEDYLIAVIVKASLLLANKDYAEAAQLVEAAYSGIKAQQLDKFTYVDKIALDFEKLLVASYAGLGRFEEALIHQKRYTEIKLKLNDEQRERLSEEMLTRFETREKETLIELQSVKLQEGAQRRRLLVIGLTLAAALVIALVVIALQKVRSNKLLRIEQAKTEAALHDRETLLREIHHRVKNNLQVVSSLLSIQGRGIRDEQALAAVNESRNRVQSMALIHQFLYGEDGLSSIDMQAYTEELCQRLQNAMVPQHLTVTIEQRIAPIRLDVDTAIPVGLIMNELITNALKHAFPNRSEGHVSVALEVQSGSLVLTVADDGVGPPSDLEHASSFGMKLLEAFKSRLGARFAFDGTQGLQVTYTITTFKTAQ